jgi:hypothetical protein
MRATIFTLILLITSPFLLAQHRKDNSNVPSGGKVPTKTKAKPKATPDDFDKYVTYATPTPTLDPDLLAAAYGTSTPTPSNEWQLIAVTKADLIYYKPSSIVRARGTVKAWTKDVPSPSTIESKRSEKAKLEPDNRKSFIIATTYTYSLHLIEVRCESKEFRIASVIDYDKDNSVLTSDDDPSEWSNIAPDSIVNNLFKKICGN